MIVISIHALRGEGDHISRLFIRYHRYFNPRPPWGGRPDEEERSAKHLLFQSTPSVGRATNKHYEGYQLLNISIHALRGEGDEGNGLRNDTLNISIHALRGEGDDILAFVRPCDFYFNPRPPWGGRPLLRHTCYKNEEISIHALRGEGDCKNIQICNAMLVHSAYKTIYFCNSCAFYLA